MTGNLSEVTLDELTRLIAERTDLLPAPAVERPALPGQSARAGTGPRAR